MLDFSSDTRPRETDHPSMASAEAFTNGADLARPYLLTGLIITGSGPGAMLNQSICSYTAFRL